MLAGLSFGAVDALTDEGGTSRTDVIRLAVMALVALGFVAQLLAALRWTAAGRRLLSSIPWPRRTGRGQSSVPPLLDRVSVARLRELAPAGLGVAGRGVAITATGRRAAGATAWFAMLFAAIALTAAGVSVLAVSLGLSLSDGVGVAEAVQMALLPIATFALLFLVRIAVVSIADPRQRRPGRVLRRLFRYLLRTFDRGVAAFGNATGVAGTAGQVGLQVTVAALATATVLSLGVAAPLIENGDNSGPGTVLVVTSPSPSPTTPARTSTPTLTLTAAPTTPTPTPTPTTPPPMTPPPTTPPPMTPPPATPPPATESTRNVCTAVPADIDSVAPVLGTTTPFPELATALSDMTDEYRDSFGLAPLRRDPILTQVAQEQANFSAARRWWLIFDGRDDIIHCDDQRKNHFDRAIGAGYPEAVVGEGVAGRATNEAPDEYIPIVFDVLLQQEDPARPFFNAMGLACAILQPEVMAFSIELSCVLVLAG